VASETRCRLSRSTVMVASITGITWSGTRHIAWPG
jgi:hypothetical protein